jgi:hypothetical protein
MWIEWMESILDDIRCARPATRGAGRVARTLGGPLPDSGAEPLLNVVVVNGIADLLIHC